MQNQLLNELVDVVTKEGASDLHLSEGRPPVIRVSGFLIPLLKMPFLTKENMQELLSILLIQERKKEFDEKLEVNFAYNH